MNPPAAWEEIERLYHEALDLPVCERETRCSLPPAQQCERKWNPYWKRIRTPGFWRRRPATSRPTCWIVNLAGSRRVNSWRIMRSNRWISIGGMGEVYLARDTEGRPVALKILRRHLIVNAQAVDRFETEARAASALCHPNIVTVYESGKSPAGLFIAMEWLDGSTFRVIMDAGVAPIAQAMDWGGQASHELWSAAHMVGILHRDMKPENIMLRKDGGREDSGFRSRAAWRSGGPWSRVRWARRERLSGTLSGNTPCTCRPRFFGGRPLQARLTCFRWGLFYMS